MELFNNRPADRKSHVRLLGQDEHIGFVRPDIVSVYFANVSQGIGKVILELNEKIGTTIKPGTKLNGELVQSRASWAV